METSFWVLGHRVDVLSYLFIVYLYQAQILSYRSALAKLDSLAPNTGLRVIQAARQEFLALAQRRGDLS